MIEDTLPQSYSENTILALCALFEELQDVLFWIKDDQLRIIELNKSFAERVKLPKNEILGKTDDDLYDEEISRVFIADDVRVMKTGKPIRRKVELLTNRWGGVEWRSTTKLPIRNHAGKVVATTGISRPMAESTDRLPPEYEALSHLIAYCRKHLADGIDVKSMAAEAGMSIATLSRRFREHLRISPGEFLAQLRLARACELLDYSRLNVMEISLECGYESSAAFSRAFRKAMGMAPRQYAPSKSKITPN